MPSQQERRAAQPTPTPPASPPATIEVTEDDLINIERVQNRATFDARRADTYEVMLERANKQIASYEKMVASLERQVAKAESAASERKQSGESKTLAVDELRRQLNEALKEVADLREERDSLKKQRWYFAGGGAIGGAWLRGKLQTCTGGFPTGFTGLPSSFNLRE